MEPLFSIVLERSCNFECFMFDYAVVKEHSVQYANTVSDAATSLADVLVDTFNLAGCNKQIS